MPKPTDYLEKNNLQIIFYVSDSTALTAKGLGQSLLSQFENIKTKEFYRPYINTQKKIEELIIELNKLSLMGKTKPIVFASIIDHVLMSKLKNSVPGVVDILQPFVSVLENLIERKSSQQVGQAHKASSDDRYKSRIEAIDFTMSADDGLRLASYDSADLILLGVSRSGKTPTALYLALNFGQKVANFPFTPDDLPKFSLKPEHIRNKHKLFGLLISPERLVRIRQERHPDSDYASFLQVKLEINAMKDLLHREKISFVETTTRSVEEIAATIVSQAPMYE